MRRLRIVTFAKPPLTAKSETTIIAIEFKLASTREPPKTFAKRVRQIFEPRFESVRILSGHNPLFH